MKKRLNSAKIIEEIEKNKEEIKKNHVKKIGLFGSFVKNKQSENSDIDVIVEFDKVTFDNYMKLKFILEDLFNKKVDVIIEKDLRPELNYIKKEVKYARL